MKLLLMPILWVVYLKVTFTIFSYSIITVFADKDTSSLLVEVLDM